MLIKYIYTCACLILNLILLGGVRRAPNALTNCAYSISNKQTKPNKTRTHKLNITRFNHRIKWNFVNQVTCKCLVLFIVHSNSIHAIHLIRLLATCMLHICLSDEESRTKWRFRSCSRFPNGLLIAWLVQFQSKSTDSFALSFSIFIPFHSHLFVDRFAFTRCSWFYFASSSLQSQCSNSLFARWIMWYLASCNKCNEFIAVASKKSQL